MAPSTRPTFEDKFSGGMDCRPGIEAKSLKTFRELHNMVINEDGALEMRWPFRKMTGQLSPLAQGLIKNGAAYFTFARRGDVIVHTGEVAGFVQTLYFDPPENMGTTWELVTAKLFENKAVAFIRHTFPGTTITSRIYMHHWDGLTNNPTYIADPYAPWDWGPAGYPVNAYGTSANTGGAWQDFTTTIEQAAEKLWAGRVDRNVGFGGIGRARIWNSRSAADIEKTGAMHYFNVPAGGGTKVFAIPEAFADFADYQKFAGYVVEQSNADGSWTKIVETAGAPGIGQWQLVSATRDWSTLPVAAISANGLPTDALIRIRILMSPEVEILTGGIMTPGSETYRGDGATIQWPSTVPFVAFSSYQVRVAGAVKPTPAYYSVFNNNGLARVDFREFAQVTDGKLTAGALVAGTGYTSFPTINLVGGSGGSGASASVTSLKAVSATIAAGGAGYTNGDVLTIVGDTGTAATFTATVAAGIVTAVTPLSGGALTVVAANPHATAGGTGAGCTLNVSYGVGTVTVVPGQGYVTAPTTNIVGGAGAGATLAITLAAPVGNTTIPYTAATDGDFGRLTVYFNGARQTEGATYTLVNSAGNAFVVPSTGLAIGTQLNARLVLPSDTLLEFVSPSLVVSAATIRYEQVTQTSTAVLLSALGPSATYYVAVAANGVVGYKLTSAIWTGLERYQIRIIGQVTTDGAGNISSTTAFQYGGEALTAWYTNRHQLNLDYWAGENEGGFINSGTHDNSGAAVTSMVAVKNRLAIFYPQATQLWQVDPAPINCAFIDRYEFGSRYEGTNFYNRPLIYTQKGFRAFDLQGLNFQSLEDVNIGEPIQSLGNFTVLSACFWPWRGGYLAFARLDGSATYARLAKLPASSIFWQEGIYGFVYLAFSKESEIRAWSFLTVAGLTAVETMIADDSKVYCLQDREVWYADDLTPLYRDGEAQATSYDCRARWHLLRVAGAIKSARMVHVDLVKSGRASFATTIMPWNAGQEQNGPETAGVTVGMQRVPLRCTGRAVAGSLLTNDPTGMVLQSIDYEIMPLGS